MATVQTSAPAVEPISLDDVKAHLRLDTSAEDLLLQSLIITARLHVEIALGLALITQTWSCFYDAWPIAGTRSGLLQPAGVGIITNDPRRTTAPAPDTIRLPLSPIRSIDAIRVYAADGTFLPLPLGDFTIDLASRTPRIVRRLGTAMPEPGRRLNGIEFAITAGFGPTSADVPAPLRQALLLLVAHWYEHRDPGEIGTPEAHMPAAIAALLSNYMPVRL